MGDERWIARWQWIEKCRELAQLEIDRLEQTARLRLGRAVLAASRKPWRVVPLVGTFLRILRTGGAGIAAPLVPPRPASPLDPPPTVETSEREPAIAENQRLWRQVWELQSSLAFRLGSALVESRVSARQARRLPRNIVRQVTHRWGPSPDAVEPALDVVLALPYEDHSPHWRCSAPKWLEEMLAYEAVPPADLEGSFSGNLLVSADDSDMVGQGAERIERAISTAERAGAQTAAWLLSAGACQLDTSLLNRCHRVFVTEPTSVAGLSERLSVPVQHLAPAVQPRIHNPIGWWTGAPDQGVRGRAENGMPGDWRNLIQVARAQPLSDAALGQLTGVLGRQLPAGNKPAWADEAFAADFVRHARMRVAIDTETVADRLRTIESAIGGEPAESDRALVTVLTPTYRPERIPQLLRNFARQTYDPKELVLVLHGEAFNVQAIRARVSEIGSPVRIVSAPRSLTLGECLQLGCRACEGAVICRMDDDDWYGEHYVHDMAATFRFSDAGVAGKPSYLLRFIANDRIYLCHPGIEYQYTVFRGGGSRLAFRREVLYEVGWRSLAVASDDVFVRDCLERAFPHIATSRFDFVFHRRDPKTHTMKRTEAEFLATSGAVAFPAEARCDDFES